MLLVAVLIVLFYYKMKDSSAWYIVLTCNTIALGPTLGLNIPVEGVFVIVFAGMLLAASCTALRPGAVPLPARCSAAEPKPPERGGEAHTDCCITLRHSIIGKLCIMK